MAMLLRFPVPCSDSSMDDCNGADAPPVVGVEHRSDSSMDDCNLFFRIGDSARVPRSDSSMDDCNFASLVLFCNFL